MIRNKLFLKIKQKTGNNFVAFFAWLFLLLIVYVALYFYLLFPKRKKQSDFNISSLKQKHNKNYQIVPIKLKDNLVDLSIIIPCYNAEKYIKKCLNSLINQKTEYSYEIIVVNDGSTDDSLQILQQIECEKLRIITTENGGPSIARNIGLENACGKYVSFVDADDYVLDGFIQKLMEPAITEKLDMVVAGYKIINNKKTTLYKLKDTKIDVKKGHTILTYGYPWGKVIKKSLFANYGFPPKCAYEDTIMSYLIYSQVKTAKFISDCLYNYIDNPTGQTKTINNTSRASDSYNVFRTCLKAMQEHDMDISGELYKFSLKTQCGSVLYSRLNGTEEKFMYEIFLLTCDCLNNIKCEEKLSLLEKRFKQAYKNFDFKNWKILSKFARII